MPCSAEPSYFDAVADLHSQAPGPCQELLASCSLPDAIDAEPTFSTSEEVLSEVLVADGQEAYACFDSSSTMLDAPWLSPSAMSTLPELATPSAGELPLPLRIVFLDIDGVLCCNQRCFLEPDKMSNLKHIVQTTGACVVLTSNWRLFEQLVQELLRVFAEYKIQCIGATPMCGMITELVRPLEIRAWLRGFEAQLADDPAEKSAQLGASMQYVAIDDRQLLDEQGGGELHGKFLLTDPTLGLTESGAAQAIEILTGTELHAMIDETRDFLAAGDASHIEFFAAERAETIGAVWASACGKRAPEQGWSAGAASTDEDSALPDARLKGGGGEAYACEESACQGSAPNESALNESAPNESAPNESAPNESAPNESAPNESAPNESAPNESAPSESARNESALQLTIGGGGAIHAEQEVGAGRGFADSEGCSISNTGSGSEPGSGGLGCAVFGNIEKHDTDSGGAAACSEREKSGDSVDNVEGGVSPLRKRLRSNAVGGGAPPLGSEWQSSGAGGNADEGDDCCDDPALDGFDESGHGGGSASKSGYYCRFGAEHFAASSFCVSARSLWERKRPLHSLSAEAATDGQDGE